MNALRRGRILTPVAAMGASVFAPSSLDNLALWLKADAGLWQDSARTTAATANGDPVGCWDDQSGNGRNVTQATSTKRFELRTAGYNGHPCLRGDGVDDVLSAAGDVALGTAHTIYLALTCLTEDGTFRAPCGGNAGAYALGWTADTTYKYSVYNGVTQHSLSQAGLPAAATPFLYALRRSGTNVEFYQDGAQEGIDQTLGGNLDLNVRYVGAYNNGTSGFAHVDIAELLAYTDAHTDPEMAQVFMYLARWA